MVPAALLPVAICFAVLLLATVIHAQGAGKIVSTVPPPRTTAAPAPVPSNSSAAAAALPVRQISNVNFAMAASDRLPGAIGKTATLSFAAASPIPAGGSITVMLPPNVFPSRIPTPNRTQEFVDDVAAPCVTGAAPSDCPPQAHYIMFWFGIVCPSGSYFAPGGIQSDGCPVIQDVQCVAGAVPLGCSEISRKISAIPSVCPQGQFAAPLGLDPVSKCPSVPSYADGVYWPNAITSGASGASSVSYASFQNTRISIGSMRYDHVLVVTASSLIPSGKPLCVCSTTRA